jgi:outer membrane protein TolC
MRALSLLALIALSATPAHAKRYTLKELIAKMTGEYAGVQAGRENVEAAKAALAQAQRMWLPTGELQFGFMPTPEVHCLNDQYNTPDEGTKHQRELNCVRSDIVDLTTSTSGASYAWKGIALQLNISLNQTLTTFGKIESQIGQAKAGVETAVANLGREQAEAVYNITRAYWGLKATRAAIETIDEGMEKLKDWTQKVDDQLSGKNTSRYNEGDLARLKIAIVNGEMLLLEQQKNRAYAEQALKILTNDPEADIDDSELEFADPDPPAPLAEWQGRALRLRPEIRALDSGLDGARHLRRLRIAEFLPDLTLQSNLNFGYANTIDTPQSWYMGKSNYLSGGFTVNLRQPLDFGMRAARYLQARHDELANAARRRATLLTYSTEISRAYADYVETRGRAEQIRKGEKVSRGWYRAVDNNVSSGLYNDGREMVEVLQNYFSFRLRYFQVIYDANTALAWLERTTVGVNTSAK